VSLKLDKEFYITLKGQCLPINWFSPSNVVEIEGIGEIQFAGFDTLNEQGREIFLSNGRIGGQQPTSIRRRRDHENIFLIEERTVGSEIKTVSAGIAEFGSETSRSYLDLQTLFFDDPLFQADFNLRTINVGPGDTGDYEHKLTVSAFDFVRMNEFAEPLKLTDTTFLSFNNLINGVDFTNEQIPGSPTFCNQNLSQPLRATDFFGNPTFKNKLIVNESSIPKELSFAIDPIQKIIILNQFTGANSNRISSSTSMSTTLNMKEYWMTAPSSQALKDAFDQFNPNDDLFDGLLSFGNIVEAIPGQDVSIFGSIRTSTGTMDALSMTMTVDLFGTNNASLLIHGNGIDYHNSVNVIQFSRGKKLFAGNGGLNLVGF